VAVNWTARMMEALFLHYDRLSIQIRRVPSLDEYRRLRAEQDRVADASLYLYYRSRRNQKERSDAA
jgi:hypothetical protein